MSKFFTVHKFFIILKCQDKTKLVHWAGDLLKLLDVSSEENTLRTSYGKLQPPLGKRRLKVFSACYLRSPDITLKKKILY